MTYDVFFFFNVSFYIPRVDVYVSVLDIPRVDVNTSYILYIPRIDVFASN